MKVSAATGSAVGGCLGYSQAFVGTACAVCRFRCRRARQPSFRVESIATGSFSFIHGGRQNEPDLPPGGLTAPPAAPLPDLFKGDRGGGLVMTLERSIGVRNGEDRQLWDTGAFSAAVYPDLPLATNWRSFGSALMRGGIGNAASPTPPAADEIRSSRWLVRTVGVQCRSRRELGEHILRQAFGNDDGDADQIGAANALLCVSGSHPVRQLSIMGRLLPSSLDTLAMAGEMKARGNLPGSLRLWAVENPLLEYDAQRLRRKIEAGAEVVVTQPPLDWDSFQRWADDADRLGLLEQCQLVVGLPMLSSAGNLAFWLQLCGAHSAPWAQSVLKRWSDEESKGAESFQEWRLQQTVELMQRIGSLPGAAGVHVMPLTKRAREDALAVIESGAIAPWVVQDD